MEQEEEEQPQTPTEDDENNDNPAFGDGGTLIVYYSYTGNNKEIAEELSAQTGCKDIAVVEPTENLDYNANNYKIGSDQINAINADPDKASSYPSIKEVSVDWSKYTTVFIATPLWHSRMASNMQSFLFGNGKAMAGKTVCLIVSSWSSSYTGVEADAKRLIPDGKFTKTLWINHSNHTNRRALIKDWLQEIIYNAKENATPMKVSVTDGKNTLTYTLNDTPAAKDLYAQLPLTVNVENYSDNEKIFYPTKSLSKSDNIEGDCPAGTLAYFSPWGNVVMFYGDAPKYSGLYILGQVTSGKDAIKNLSGKITVTKAE